MVRSSTAPPVPRASRPKQPKGIPRYLLRPTLPVHTEETTNRIDETYDTVVSGAKANRDRYVWEELGSYGETRITAIHRFLEDFSPG